MDGQKWRHEYKFPCSEAQWTVIKARIEPLMERDAHAREQGFYEIRSIYFDDIYDTCYRRNETGTDRRAKYRIRAYNGSDKVIRLEKKIKQRGMTAKRSLALTREQYELFVAGDYAGLLRDGAEAGKTDDPSPYGGGERENAVSLLRELAALGLMRSMRPRVIVSYERYPYVDRAGNVRVTFDKNIASSVSYEDFFAENPLRIPVMAVGQHLLEVKFDEFLPGYIREIMENGSLRQTTFSKYYICRQERMRR